MDGRSLSSRAGAREDGISLVDDPDEGQNHLHGDVREEDGGLLGLGDQVQGGGQEGTQWQNDCFVNLNR